MPNSLIDFRDWTQTKLQNIFDLSFSLEKQDSEVSDAPIATRESFSNKTAALIFFEASTRTRVSFEQACFREGIRPSLLTGKASTSLEKGESYLDTVLNVAAMGPDVIIIRCGDDLDLRSLEKKTSQPILNGGWGINSHPTQALLDMRTLLKQGLKFQDTKLLIVGDVRHSRVASSHFELALKMGYEVAVCCPESMSPQQDVRSFSQLRDGLEWANAVLMLRFQFERHGDKPKVENLMDFQLGLSELRAWKNQGWLMHPGPVNYGVELRSDVEEYQRNLILKQVESGVWIRRACLHQVLGKR